MTGEVLLNDRDYITLRVESREALYKLGIPSNPAFTNQNIVDGLSRALGISTVLPEDIDSTEYSGEFFRDTLGEILNLELPPSIEDVVTGLRNISTNFY